MRRRLVPSDHKYSRGVVAIIAGSNRFPGAAILAVGGARRGNAGYVKYVSANKRLRELVVARFPDVVPVKSLKDERADALVIGPGASSLRRIPKNLPVVLDSAAMSAVKDWKYFGEQPVVVTPHEGELHYLGIEGAVLSAAGRRSVALEIAQRYRVICVLKGSRTVVASPDGDVHIDKVGGSELSCAGSGDLLAGLIGSFLVTVKDGASAFELVCSAVRLHSQAGKYAAGRYKSVTSLEIMESLALV